MSMYVKTASGVSKLLDVYAKTSSGVDKIWNEPKPGLQQGFNVVDMSPYITGKVLDIAFPKPDTSNKEAHGTIVGVSNGIDSKGVIFVNFPDLKMWKVPAMLFTPTLPIVPDKIMYNDCRKYPWSDNWPVDIAINGQMAGGSPNGFISGGSPSNTDIAAYANINDGYYCEPIEDGYIFQSKTANSGFAEVINSSYKFSDGSVYLSSQDYTDYKNCTFVCSGRDYNSNVTYLYGIQTKKVGLVGKKYEFFLAHDSKSTAENKFSTTKLLYTDAATTESSCASISRDGYLVKYFQGAAKIVEEKLSTSGPTGEKTNFDFTVRTSNITHIASDIGSHVRQCVVNSNKIYDYETLELLYECSSTIHSCKVYKDESTGVDYVYYLCDDSKVIIYKS